LATPLGTENQLSVATTGKIPKPGEVDPENISRPTFEQFSVEKAMEEIRKKIREEHEQKIQRKEDEATKHYMSHFSVDRHEKITKLKEVTFDASEFEVKTDEQSALDSEIANMIDGVVVSYVNNKLELLGQNLHSMFDTRFSRIETHLGMSPIGDDKNASTSNTDKIMGNWAGIPNDATLMGSARQSLGQTNGTTPYHKTLYNSTPNANVPPQGRQVHCDMFLHRRTLLNLMVHRSQIGLTPMILDQTALKRRLLRYFGKALV